MSYRMAKQLAARYILEEVIEDICSQSSFQKREASLRDFTPSVLKALSEAFLFDTGFHYRKGFLSGLAGKIKKLWALFKRAPELWEKIKEFLGISGITDIPAKLKEWAKTGLAALKKLLRKVFLENPIAALYVVPRNRMPGISNMLNRIITSSPLVARAIQNVSSAVVQPLDDILAKSPLLKNLARPVLAAVYIWIWMNVAELSWDPWSLLKGFTGSITLGELFNSLPESALGFLIAALFPGLGTFGLLPLTIMARLIYLLSKKAIQWVKGKGFRINWSKMAVDLPDEFVPVF